MIDNLQLSMIHLKVKETGISFDTFACLAKCQGLGVHATRASDSSLEEFRQTIKQICTTTPTNSNGTQHPTSFLIVSYTRKVLKQTGTGHFSPIGAYDEASDSVLLLDTARFKYGPHWVQVGLLFEALIPLDPSTNKSRGFMVLSYNGVDDDCNNSTQLSHLPVSLMFRPRNSANSVKEYKQFVKDQRKVSGNNEIELQSVVSYWTQSHTNATFVHELILPQLRPIDSKELEMVESIQELLKTMIKRVDESLLELNLASNRKSCHPEANNECCNTTTQSLSQRYLQISSIESIFIVYLASLTKESRDQMIAEETLRENIDVNDTVMEQLMAEVSLISYAIETSDLEM